MRPGTEVWSARAVDGEVQVDSALVLQCEPKKPLAVDYCVVLDRPLHGDRRFMSRWPHPTRQAALANFESEARESAAFHKARAADLFALADKAKEMAR